MRSGAAFTAPTITNGRELSFFLAFYTGGSFYTKMLLNIYTHTYIPLPKLAETKQEKLLSQLEQLLSIDKFDTDTQKSASEIAIY